MSAAPVFTPISRTGLKDLIVREILQAGTGNAGTRLPSERSLCAELGVSRPTLRKALEQLEMEGVLSSSGPRGERIILRGGLPTKATRPVLRILQDGSPSCFLGEHLQTTCFLAGVLSRLGGNLTIENMRSCFSRKPEASLRKVVESSHADLWLLHRSTRRMQEWFGGNNIPAVVLGSAWSSSGLPGVDSDHAAVAHHAAGMLKARGHHRMAVVFSESLCLGDTIALQAFEETVVGIKDKGVTLQKVFHDGTIRSIQAVVDRLLNSKNRPDGWFVFGAHYYLTIFCRLAERGVMPGQEISMISRDYDPMFLSLIPSPAHYRRNLEQMHRRLGILIKENIRARGTGDAAIRIPVVFHDGASLRRVAAASRATFGKGGGALSRFL